MASGRILELISPLLHLPCPLSYQTATNLSDSSSLPHFFCHCLVSSSCNAWPELGYDSCLTDSLASFHFALFKYICQPTCHHGNCLSCPNYSWALQDQLGKGLSPKLAIPTYLWFDLCLLSPHLSSRITSTKPTFCSSSTVSFSFYTNGSWFLDVSPSPSPFPGEN